MIHGCRVARSGAHSVSHTFSTNDSLMFFKANNHGANEAKRCLKDYECLVNFNKSCITFSRNTDAANKDVVAEM